MIRNRLLLRSIIVFLLFELVFSIVAPTISWALTSGPSMPEFSSFEPVDTTDMVNLATGDLTYNMPLLEVPGPSGGYPLSLSYHSGVKPEYEASWVGLGFTLNPGAINRVVNGFADDNYNVRREVRDYWAGGESLTKAYTLGVSIPNTGIGLNWTHTTTRDTYKGFSAKDYYGVSVDPVAMGMNIGAGTFGKDMFKMPTGGGSAFSSLGWMDYLVSPSVDFSISSSGIKTTATVAGHTFGQKNSSGSIYTKSNTTNRGDIRFWFFSLGLRDYYTRYWSDQSDALYTYGPLYFGKNNHEDHYEYYNGVPDDGDPDYGESEFRAYANDIYDIPDQPFRFPMNTYDSWDQADPTRQVGGSLPSYDQYFVLGQGLSGAIEPTIFENGVLKGQNSYFRHHASGGAIPGLPTIKHNSLRQFSSTKKVHYRFKNDFSNSLTMSPGKFAGSTNLGLVLSRNTVTAPEAGYIDNPSQQRLAGSKHVEWFTNSEIHNGSAKNNGFIDCYASRTERSLSMDVYDDYLQPEASIPVYQKDFRGKANGIITTDSYPSNIQSTYVQPYRFNSLKPRNVSLAEKIGGYMITNESGVTYHYALPVYNKNEYTRLKLKKPAKGAATISETRNNEPYAYTWLLTAVTGPDYVDRSADGSANGILDEYDYGYWVKFDYGKWSDSFQWRTPHTGYASDFESEYETFSYGIKELYYLDAIETKTHKAIFVKSKRKDGRGVTSRLEGGSNPRKYTMHYLFNSDNTEATGTALGFRERGSISYSVSPVSTLKLDAIYLFDKNDLENIPLKKDGGDKYDDAPISNPHVYKYQGEGYRYQFPFPVVNAKVITIRPDEDAIKVKYHNGDLVFDDEDIANLELQGHSFKQKALKTIEFETDYSLSSGVPNSFNYFSDFQDRPCSKFPANNGYNCYQQGTNFDFEWPQTVTKGCYDNIIGQQPMCCDYKKADGTEFGKSYSKDASAFYSYDPLDGMRLQTCKSDFMGNDNITYGKTGKLTLKAVKILGHGGVSLIPPTTFAYNKNPEYSADKYDDWGYYKSDFKNVSDLEGPSEVFVYDGMSTTYQTSQLYKGSRRITDESAQNTDAWSLTSVTTPLGGELKISYESNDVNRSVLNNSLVFSIDKLVRRGTNQVDIYFKEKGLKLSDYFSTANPVSVQALVISKYSGGGLQPYGETYVNTPDQVAAIADKYITINSSALNALIKDNRSIVISGSTRTANSYFVAGSVYIPLDETSNKYAGGIRVKSISIDEFRGHTRSTNYSYTKPGTTLSSGVTSFQPFNAVAINFPTDIKFFNDLAQEESWENARIALTDIKTDFLHRMNRLYEDVLVYARETPGPGALYEYVTVQERYDDIDVLQYERYQFQPFEKSMVGIDRNQHDTDEYLREFKVYNNAVDVGNLLRRQVISANNTILHETKYGYLFDDTDESFELTLKDKKQGILEQTFHKYISLKEYKFDKDEYKYSTIHEKNKAILTTRIDRSNVLTSVAETNYKTGQVSKTQFTNFDFYTGKAIEIRNQDPSGVQYLTSLQPAYTVPDYSGMSPEQVTAQTQGMGLKIKNPKNKHMLTQEAVRYIYKSNVPGDLGLMSVTAQSWSDEIPASNYKQPLANATPQPGIWRKNASFTFIGDENVPLRSDGMYPVGSYTDFSAWKRSDPISIGWQMNSRVTLYDVYSSALEEEDLNGNYSAIAMSTDGKRVVATASPSRYSEFGYAGAEDKPTIDNLSGLVAIDVGGVRSSETAHTGSYSVKTDYKGYVFESDITPFKRYQVSVWSSSPDIQLKYTSGNGTETDFTPTSYKQVGEWYLFSTSIFPKNPHLKVWCQVPVPGEIVYFDDFRIHPFEATMNSFVYNKFGELAYVLDNNNFYIHYDYDAMGRLTGTTKETLNGIKQINATEYKYKGQN